MLNFFKDIAIMLELEVRRIMHDRTELYMRVVQPILWLVVYGTIMGNIRAIPTGGVPYVDFITPGVIMQSTVFISIFFGLTMVWERESGILKKLLVTPASRYSIVIGRSMAAGFRAVFLAVFVIIVALLIGVVIVPNPLYFIAAILIIFFVAGGFAALSIFFACFLKTRERFMGIGQVITLPLFFLSNALYPMEIMPPILRDISAYNPMSYAVDAVRSLMITNQTSTLLIDVAVIVMFDIAMFVIASRAFKRIIE